MPIQHAFQVGYYVTAGELEGRDVEVDSGCGFAMFISPCRCLSNRVFHELQTKRNNEARVFGKLDESVRWDWTKLRMCPSRQCLGGDERPITDLDDRLVDEAELILLFQSRMEMLLEFDLIRKRQP
jgi:hypothetical protein